LQVGPDVPAAVGQASNLSKSYSADGLGQIVASGADIPLLRAMGFQESGKQRSVTFQTGVATGTTSFQVGQIPAGAYIQKIILNNVTGNAAGNITIGSTSGGSDVVASVALGANGLLDTTLAKSVFSASVLTQLFITSSAWGSANVSVTVIYGYF
jgi:hypothetical protein